MALSKDQKAALIDEVSGLLAGSKLTVAARYPGTSVKAMQSLRKSAKEHGTTVKVVKNRLFLKAVESTGHLKDSDTSEINGQLLYAFNDQDEVAPAQDLANFAKVETQLEFVVGYTADGQVLGPDDLKVLADLPNKDQLRAMLAGTIAAPLSSFANVLAGNVRGVLNVLNARAESLGN